MPFVRITMARPRPEVRNRVRDNFRELLATSAKHPGYLGGYVLESTDPAGEVGRVTIWESQSAANAAASDPHVLAVHSELRFDDRGTLQDWNLEGTEIEPSPSDSAAG
jgi:quinol monooxygenase YgiN